MIADFSEESPDFLEQGAR